MFYLEEHPEDFETVRALLGHSFAKTTLIYAGASGRRASKAYGKFVTGQREALKLKGRGRLGARQKKNMSAPGARSAAGGQNKVATRPPSPAFRSEGRR